jgi:hypothetical protein
MKDFIWSDIFTIIGGKNKIFFLRTYLPMVQIAESERGNKEYFNLGLIEFFSGLFRLKNWLLINPLIFG